MLQELGFLDTSQPGTGEMMPSLPQAGGVYFTATKQGCAGTKNNFSPSFTPMAGPFARPNAWKTNIASWLCSTLMVTNECLVGFGFKR